MQANKSSLDGKMELWVGKADITLILLFRATIKIKQSPFRQTQYPNFQYSNIPWY
jgi:hypothetical protein